MNLNKVQLIGRLTADPETRSTPGGQNVSTIRMATNRVWMDRNNQKQEQVEFHSVVCWGKLSDIVSQYVRRGQLLYIEGRLQTRNWTSQDNTKHYRTEIIAETLQMGPKAAGTGEGYSAPTSAPRAPRPASSGPVKEEDIPVINQEEPIMPEPSGPTGDVEEQEIDLKDIPF